MWRWAPGKYLVLRKPHAECFVEENDCFEIVILCILEQKGKRTVACSCNTLVRQRSVWSREAQT